MGHPEQPAPTPVGGPKSLAKPTGPAAESAHDPARFTLADMVRCGAALRILATESTSMEQAAQKVTQYLYENLRDKTSNNRSCVLVRLFKTHTYARLPEELRAAAVSMASSAPLSDETKCLTLLATTGDEPLWNSRRSSRMHKCIPLASEAIVEQFPMVSQLIRQLGLTTTELLRTTPEIIKDLEQKSFGVFHIPVAAGSLFVPAQKDFVEPCGIASALGFGGILPDGDLFVVIIFARVAIPSSTAEMFRTIAVNLKLGMLALIDQPVFAD